MRARLGPGCVLAAALAVAVPEAALAQSTVGGGRGTPLVPDADTVPPMNFTGSIGVRYGSSTSRAPFQLAPVAVTIGVLNRLDLGVALGAVPPGDLAAPSSPNPQLTLKLRGLVEGPRRPALALLLRAEQASRGWDVAPSLVLHKNRGPLLVTGEVGYRFRTGPASEPGGAFYGVGLGYWLSAETSLFLQAVRDAGPGGRTRAMPGIAWSLLGPDPLEKRREALRIQAKQAVAALENELNVKLVVKPEGDARRLDQEIAASTARARPPILRVPGRVTIFATAGPSIGGASMGWQVLAGVQISSFDEFLQDSDGDGIPDRVDRCPYEPEDWDGYEDEDGCPDHGAVVLRRLGEAQQHAASEETRKLTTPEPRFRLQIPLGEVPAPGSARRETAPMYQPMEAPPEVPGLRGAPPAAPEPRRLPAPRAPAPPTPAPPTPAPPTPAPPTPAPPTPAPPTPAPPPPTSPALTPAPPAPAPPAPPPVTPPARTRLTPTDRPAGRPVVAQSAQPEPKPATGAKETRAALPIRRTSSVPGRTSHGSPAETCQTCHAGSRRAPRLPGEHARTCPACHRSRPPGDAG